MSNVATGLNRLSLAIPPSKLPSGPRPAFDRYSRYDLRHSTFFNLMNVKITVKRKVARQTITQKYPNPETDIGRRKTLTVLY